MAARTIHFARLGYPHILEPRAVEQNGKAIGDPRFSCNVHIPASSTEIIAQLQQDIFNAIVERWPDPAKRPRFAVQPGSPREKWVQTPGFSRIPLVWGPAAFPNDPNATGWVLVAAAKADAPPTVVDVASGVPSPLHDPARQVYPGVEAHVSVGVFAYPLNGGGVSAGLNGVALTGREVGRFDSRPTVSQMFGALPTEAPPVPESNFQPRVSPANQMANPVDPYANPASDVIGMFG